MQKASSRIWTRVAETIFYANNDYTSSTPAGIIFIVKYENLAFISFFLVLENLHYKTFVLCQAAFGTKNG